MPKGMDGRLLWRRTLPLLACLLIVPATLTAVAGCGSGSDTPSTVATAAKRVVRVQPVRQDRWTYARARFNEMCAGCHTLSDAGARGRRYNLDHAGNLEETHVRATIAWGEPGMPSWRHVLSKREYEELVAYIVSVAKGTEGKDYWHEQLLLRISGEKWSRTKTDRLERYALRLARE